MVNWVSWLYRRGKYIYIQLKPGRSVSMAFLFLSFFFFFLLHLQKTQEKEKWVFLTKSVMCSLNSILLKYVIHLQEVLAKSLRKSKTSFFYERYYFFNIFKGAKFSSFLHLLIPYSEDIFWATNPVRKWVSTTKVKEKNI